ncbi:DUF6597 domain-containing transcriptional factor [Vallitalea pronyensis]|uniref:DUF6597 domain-containing transcriptional factor n=1 Tax=Vallitalea pronyensis TaxID=1348613 RepID=UPI001FE9E471|nr:DUF6597 domain-containing transcriptional factor [Vallitalea pronyensis]
MYYEIKPNNILKDYIESYWVMKDIKEDYSSVVEPDGCFDIVIYFFDDRNKVLLTGIWEKPIIVNSYKDVSVLGVRFYHISINLFFDYKINELKILWGVVAFRLIITFSFESMLSLLPRNTKTVPIPHDIIYQQSPQINRSS